MHPTLQEGNSFYVSVLLHILNSAKNNFSPSSAWQTLRPSSVANFFSLLGPSQSPCPSLEHVWHGAGGNCACVHALIMLGALEESRCYVPSLGPCTFHSACHSNGERNGGQPTPHPRYMVVRTVAWDNECRSSLETVKRCVGLSELLPL